MLINDYAIIIIALSSVVQVKLLVTVNISQCYMSVINILQNVF